jgi:hypothetical protein
MAEKSKLSDADIERIVKRLRESLPTPVFPAVIMPPPMEWPKPLSPKMDEVWCRAAGWLPVKTTFTTIGSVC